MTITWTLKRSTTVPGDENIGITVQDVIMEIETGSVKEACGFFEQEDSHLHRIFGMSPLSRIDFSETERSGEPVPAAEAGAEPAKRTRGKAKVVEAVAPAPLPVPALSTEQGTTLPPNALNAAPVAPPPPAAPVPLPVPTETPAPPPPPAAPAATLTSDGNGIPAFLDRTNPVTAVALAPPPPTLPSPPLAPPSSPPPVGVLGPKVVAALDVMKAGSNGQDPTGQRLSDWLASAGVTIKGQSYDDACRAVLMISDEKLTAAGIPNALKVS